MFLRVCCFILSQLVLWYVDYGNYRMFFMFLYLYVVFVDKKYVNENVVF